MTVDNDGIAARAEDRMNIRREIIVLEPQIPPIKPSAGDECAEEQKDYDSGNAALHSFAPRMAASLRLPAFL
jgi:hypothetical protein